MEIRNLCKSYQVAGKRLDVLDRLSLHADDRGITVVLGRSGCGKTTLLRLIAGLEEADAGEILPEGSGRLGVIFQEPRLMPWLTVGDNILFGAGQQGTQGTGGRRRRDRRGRQERLDRLLKLTGLEGFENAYPAQLSGGMQQRTALARALASDPDYLLMDEPFAALDYFTRRQMQRELLNVWRKEQTGVLFVTHSIEEALALGTKILILDSGSCRKEYDLSGLLYPREVLGQELFPIREDIIRQIEEEEETG